MGVPEQGRRGAKDGELVLAEQIGPKARMGLPKASVVERLATRRQSRIINRDPSTWYSRSFSG